jgi:hypothetical protein
MKRLLLTLGAAFVFAGLVFAQAKTTPITPKNMEQPKLVGFVMSVDAIANTITIKTPKGDETLAVEKNAKIKAEGKDIKLADVKKDSKVAAHYKTEAGKKIVTSIHVLPTKATKPVAPAKK